LRQLLAQILPAIMIGSLVTRIGGALTVLAVLGFAAHAVQTP